jgi:Ca-activated chloride channel family protein
VYNRGVSAYRTNDFAAAAETFEQALSSPDRSLQERAFYNLGNTCYRLGEGQQPQQTQQLWQRAIKHYETALAIDPNDADAKFNREFVKKKLEELKQQQQQQQQNQQNQDKQDQDKKQDQKKDDQQKQDQQSKQDQKKDEQQKQDQQQQKKQEKEKEKEQEQEKQKQQQQQKQDQQQAQGQPGKPEKQQAAALLDNLREDEQNWNFFPEVQMKNLKNSGPPAKDW